ncbi:hypothetical protein GQ600_9332 [Phytophthora cactorum]|nr:hypothetical protein GQ600_9332 [Phytophthora cactorum]
MPGLSASGYILPADDPRGHHSTVVLRVPQAGAADYPIDVDTEEVI